ncbi:hypothetical protein [Rhodopila sp.]|uniref:hypothetical protein n=1 Tax=Rhodopila sp. TaxID=2480087 RepID=UPI003D117F7F
MNQVQTSRPVIPAARPLLSAISLLLLLAVLAVVLFITLRAPLKDDIAWLLYVARRWMAGRELYIDVIEVNPPLIIWISAVPISLAQWLDVDIQCVAMPVFIAMVLACVWWSASLLRANGGLLAHRVPVFAVIGSIFLIVPGADLGQREHLLVAAFLPYLVLFAQRLDRRHASIAVLVAAGVLAGLGCALKPCYALVFVALECLALTRGLRPWRVMPVAAAVTLLGYAGLVAIVCPAYFGKAVPLALALYGATDVPFLMLLGDSALLIGGQLVAIALLWLRRRSLADFSLLLTLVIFAATSTVICFVDGKGWYYHRLPATIITMLALLLWSISELVHRRRPVRLPFMVAALAIGVFCITSVQRIMPAVEQAVDPKTNTVAHLERIIRAQHARTYLAFSEWLAVGFPVVNSTGVGWASRFDSMWALKGEVWRARFDPAATKQWPVARWVSHDFIAGCPDIAVVDTRQTTNYISVLSAADSAFVRAWSRYRRIAAFDGLVVYRRGKGGCRDVWVAAESGSDVKVR